MRRLFVLVLLLGTIGGLTWLLTFLLRGGAPQKSDEAEAVATASETPVATPAPTPTPELPTNLSIDASGNDDSASIGYQSDIYIRRDAATGFSRETAMSFLSGSEYTSLEGILTYGGNNYRDTFSYGKQVVSEKALAQIWESATGTLDCGADGAWSGTGWTGSPIIVRWPDDVRACLGIYDEFKEKQGFTEVIYPAMDGKIYFFELTTGKATRDAINTGVVNKGTASLDPRGYPLLYLGQGIQSTSDEGTYGAWFRIVSLIDNTVIYSFGGRDPVAYRVWQAYDSSALLDAETDTLLVAGENGLLYTLKLNTAFDPAAGTVSVEPDKLAKYRYTASGYGETDNSRWYGVESSVAAWGEYAFFTDNGGLLQCVGLNTYTPEYVLDIGGDGDAGVVIEESYDDKTVYLYTASKTTGREKEEISSCVLRKINGLTGEIIWESAYEAYPGDSISNGGAYGTPCVGKYEVSNMVIFALTSVPVDINGAAVEGGKLVALDKATGRELWSYENSAGYWSTPVAIYDDDGNAYIIQCDVEGIMRLHDAKTGEALSEVDLGSRIDSTPAVFGNTLVVGTRGIGGSGDGSRIIGVRIK